MGSPPDRHDPHRIRYERWVADHAAELYRYARGLTGETTKAEDLLQDTFVEAWRSMASLREEGSARAWLFQIMRHRYSRLLRKQTVERRASVLPERLEDHPPDRDCSALDRLARRDALDHSLARLPPDIRRTFLMVFLEQLTCRETATALKIPLGTVLSRLDSARRNLRRTLAGAFDAPESRRRTAAPPARAKPTPQGSSPAESDADPARQPCNDTGECTEPGRRP